MDMGLQIVSVFGLNGIEMDMVGEGSDYFKKISGRRKVT
jgi:hypothetical protein